MFIIGRVWIVLRRWWIFEVRNVEREVYCTLEELYNGCVWQWGIHFGVKRCAEKRAFEWWWLEVRMFIIGQVWIDIREEWIFEGRNVEREVYCTLEELYNGCVWQWGIHFGAKRCAGKRAFEWW
jgi:hypothetical protein